MSAVLNEVVGARAVPVMTAVPAVAGTGGLDTSVGKALAVLDAFRGDGLPLGVSQVAARAGLPKSTTHRLLAVLVQHGYVERSDTRYRLGRAIFELGLLVSDCHPRRLRVVAAPFMTRLHEATHATVQLAVLDACDIVYVDKIYGQSGRAGPGRVGGRVPALCTALGQAILAFSPREAREAALARPVPRLTPRTVVNQSALRASLLRTRAIGIAEDRESTSLGARCIAAPIIDRGQSTIGAISISFTASAQVPAAAIGLLRQAAFQIGEAA